MGVYDKIEKVKNKILLEQGKLKVFEKEKKEAGTLGAEKKALMEVEKQKAYIKGLKEAIEIIGNG